tara:strand:- start:1059 stop:1256 length:198 start_codon:yes stop_codon:yes gene_type:complete
MKPKPINTLDTTLQSKKMSLEIPVVGKIESDSGNHLYDVFSVIFVIAVLYVGKKYLDQMIEKFRL